jgi:hypothetical protein
VSRHCLAAYLSAITQAPAYEASHEANESPNKSDEESFYANEGTYTTHPVADKAAEEQSDTQAEPKTSCGTHQASRAAQPSTRKQRERHANPITDRSR